MKEFIGFAGLLANIDKLPIVGWVFVNTQVDRASYEALRSTVFYVAEDDMEEIYFEKSKQTFIECPIFTDIKFVVDRSPIKPDLQAYLEATIYYIENDDFLEGPN